MKSYLKTIYERIEGDGDQFASSFNRPQLHQWIASNYANGHKSKTDYDIIIHWYDQEHPRITQYSFNSALETAKQYDDQKRQNAYNPTAELSTNDIELKFDDGKCWLNIHKDDIEPITHRLNYDCKQELNSSDRSWALRDSHDHYLCVIINTGENTNVIGYNNSNTNFPKEIKALCVKKGLEIVPEAFTDDALPEAISNGEINLDTIQDPSRVIKRLDPQSIIKCELMNKCHYAPLGTIFRIYQITGHTCLLVYVFCTMISHGITNTRDYGLVKSAVNSDQDALKILSNIQSNDTRPYAELAEQMVSEISHL